MLSTAGTATISVCVNATVDVAGTRLQASLPEESYEAERCIGRRERTGKEEVWLEEG